MQRINFSGKISELFPKKLKKGDFIIIRPQSLFGPDWSLKERGLCPHCGRKLYPILKKPGFMLCKSKIHKGQKVFKVIHIPA